MGEYLVKFLKEKKKCRLEPFLDNSSSNYKPFGLLTNIQFYRFESSLETILKLKKNTIEEVKTQKKIHLWFGFF